MKSEIKREALAKIPILEGMSDEEIDLLREHVSLVEFEVDENVLEEGKQNDRLLCILTGELRVWRKGRPNDLILAEVGAGDLIGELSFVEPGLAMATVTALEAGSAVTLSAADLRRLETTHPSAAIALYRRVALTLKKRLTETTAFITTYRGIQEALNEVDDLRHSLGKLI
jgi:CRP/FNR family cyclic AMP-dependent transcriptional regulator